jgi:NTE family protein
VRTGNLEYFDTTQMRLDPRHIMASGALPPGFAAVEIDGEYYWDGGVVSNTPLTHVVSSQPSRDTLAFQVDLWPARGPMPEDLIGVSARQKDIQYSSRTRTVTNQMERIFQLKHGLQRLLDLLPAEQRNAADLADLRALSCSPVYNIVHLIYQSKPYERHSKDYEFGMDAMRDHWASGLTDMRHTLTQPHYLDKPSPDKGFATHDVHRNQL